MWHEAISFTEFIEMNGANTKLSSALCMGLFSTHYTGNL